MFSSSSALSSLPSLAFTETTCASVKARMLSLRKCDPRKEERMLADRLADMLTDRRLPAGPTTSSCPDPPIDPPLCSAAANFDRRLAEVSPTSRLLPPPGRSTKSSTSSISPSATRAVVGRTCSVPAESDRALLLLIVSCTATLGRSSRPASLACKWDIALFFKLIVVPTHIISFPL